MKFDRRKGKDRRSGKKRRQLKDPDYSGPEKRSGKERRSGKDRRSYVIVGKNDVFELPDDRKKALDHIIKVLEDKFE